MAQRFDYFFGQIVTEAELDAGLAALETADRALAIDVDQALVDLSAAPTIDGGIHKALVTSFSGFDVTVTGPGVAYDNQGRRIATAANLTVSVTATGETAVGLGGTPTGGSATDPGVGLERWVSLFVRFERKLSVPRVDNNSVAIDYQQDESFVFKVTMGSPDVSPTRPALESGMVLLADFRRSNAAILEMSTTRRHDWLVREDATTFPIRTLRSLTTRSAITSLLAYYNDHVRLTGASDKHPASQLDYGGGGNWADGTTNPAATVEAQLDKIISDLAGSSGTARVGTAARAGAAGTSGVLSIGAGTLKQALDDLQDAVNSRVLRSGDTVSGNLVPDATGKDLGATGARWDVFASDLTVTQVISNLIPSSAGLGLGSAVKRWDAHLDTATVYTALVPSGDGTIDLGSAAATWKDIYGVTHRWSPAKVPQITIPASAGRFESDWVSILGTTTTTTRDNIRTTATPAGDTNSLVIPIGREVPDGATILGISVVWSGQVGDTLKFAAYREANSTTDTRTVLDVAGLQQILRHH